MKIRNGEGVNLRRFLVQLRAEEGTPEGVLRGYASVYDVSYRIGWGLKEEIAPGCFKDSLAECEGVIPIFLQHDWDNPIGVGRATEDAHGVFVEVQLFIQDVERARAVWLAAKAGALREWSIGFYPGEIAIRTDEDSGVEIERVMNGDLAEASVVVRGANPMTEMIEVRARKLAKVSPSIDALRVKAARTRDSDSDEDPGAVAQALDAMIDLIFDEVNEGDMDPESLIALLTALDVVVDHLLDLLGVVDPGEDETNEPPETEGAPIVPGYLLDRIDEPRVREIIREIYAKAVK